MPDSDSARRVRPRHEIDSCSPEEFDDLTDKETDKKLRRKMRNRESAKASRERKQNQFEQLEMRVVKLNQEKAEFIQIIKVLMDDNTRLRQLSGLPCVPDLVSTKESSMSPISPFNPIAHSPNKPAVFDSSPSP